MKSLLLFDVDGTITESGCEIDTNLYSILKNINLSLYDLGIVGGGTYDKIKTQIKDIPFQYIFSECGSVYHNNDKEIYKNSILKHEIFPFLHFFIKKSFLWIKKIFGKASGHYIDIRNGLVYISLTGLSASKSIRLLFYEEDKKYHFRKKIVQDLKELSFKLGMEEKLSIKIGGSTGITIYPKEWSKVQILKILPVQDYDSIYFFGDRYEEDGNDYDLIHHSSIIGIKVDSIEETKKKLEKILNIQ